MVTVHEIVSLEDPGARLFARLTEGQLRAVGGAAGGPAAPTADACAPAPSAPPTAPLSASPPAGLFIAESPYVIQRGLENGFVPFAALCEHSQVAWMTQALEQCAVPGQPTETSQPQKPLHLHQQNHSADQQFPEIPIYTADTQLLRHMTGFALTRGVMCAFRRPDLPAAEDICRDASRIAVLDGIVDSTNIGAIFRSAAALGFDAVLLTRTCCDPLNRRVARVSMGAVLQVPWTWLEFPGPTSISNSLRHMGFKTVAMALREGARALDDPQIMQEPRLAVVFGNEGNGLSDRDIDEADYVVCIPMSHGVDSLNVAHTASISFWQLRPR